VKDPDFGLAGRVSILLDDGLMSLQPPLPFDVLSLIRDAAHEAGDIAMGFYRRGAETSARVWSKSGGSPVTQADVAVDAYLKIRLSAAWPEPAWLSEETVDDNLRLTRRFVWVVDPIDGTRAFMAGSQDWAVCVALLDAGKPIAGIVHAPACEASYEAVLGGGATCNGAAINVSSANAIAGSRIAGPKPMLDALARQAEFISADKIPSLALRLTRVADSSIDAGLVSPDSRDWDLAAADLILSEAGGLVTRHNGDPMVYNRPTPVHATLVAAGKQLHVPLIEAFGVLHPVRV
jgi:myo-inositol-1(or 4)-monophosphatase